MLIKIIFSRCDQQTNINKYRSLYYFITIFVGLYGSGSMVDHALLSTGM